MTLREGAALAILSRQAHVAAFLQQRAERQRLAGRPAAGVLFLIGGLEAGPFAVEPVGLVGLVAGSSLEFGIEPRAPVGLGLLDLAFGHRAFGHQPL